MRNESEPSRERGRLARRYRLVKRLGDGEMGDVYRANDEVVAREVVIKILVSAVALEAPRSERRRRAEPRTELAFNDVAMALRGASERLLRRASRQRHRSLAGGSAHHAGAQ